MLKESTFSKRLKDLRKKAGLKQVELADLSGIDPNLVSRYERGESIPIGGMINIGTTQECEESLKKIIASFQKACWMFDHNDEAEAQIPDFNATVSAIQPA